MQVPSIKISAKKMWDLEKPRFNGYACGYGPHGSKKYNRSKNKKDFKKQLESER